MSARSSNRLAAESSPYLRQHAGNPVDWFPWGEAAFARARSEQKPIFLSVGYSTCHWCHVMAHESFENEAVARLLNDHFISVKVDREERPDVDRVYMAYVQAVTGQGGWPMSVWLTPELQPFYGGTYFPPEDRWGRPGMVTLLAALARAWTDRRESLVAEADRVVGQLRAYAAGAGPGRESNGAAGPAESALAAAADPAIGRGFRHFVESFDPTHGGFGGAPKFPRAAAFDFLQWLGVARRPPSDVGAVAGRMAAVTLRKMAEGGIRDHVGGGFHRYSVDEEWFVPHFEKMLYDQAQLVPGYLAARQATGDERYAWVARDILDYVLRDLASPDGGFYSAEDADSAIPEGAGHRPENGPGPAEGAFYLWTREEIDRLLGAEAGLFCAHFDVQAAGNIPAERDPHGEFRGGNILRQRRALADTARQAGISPEAAGERLLAGLLRLREERARRPRPARDEKVVAAWNGLMISALARSAQVLGDPEFGAAAVRAAEFLRRELFDEQAGTLRRSWCAGRGGESGFAEDYACVIQGLLDLYEWSFDEGWLRWAERLQGALDERFWDDAGGGYWSSPASDPAILVRMKEDYDGAEPAPGSVAAMNLVRLGWMLDKEPGAAGRPAYHARALRCLAAYRGRWEDAPQALPRMLCALELALQPPRTLVLAGDPRSDGFRALAAVVHERARPRRALLASNRESAWLRERAPWLGEMTAVGGRAAAYLCENRTCQQPVTTPEELRLLLDT